jgi:hypothetical protein
MASVRFYTFRWFPEWGQLYFLFIEGVIEGEDVILNIFGNSVYFVFWFVDFDLGIGAGDGVYFSTLFLFFEDGSLAYADS